MTRKIKLSISLHTCRTSTIIASCGNHFILQTYQFRAHGSGTTRFVASLFWKEILDKTDSRNQKFFEFSTNGSEGNQLAYPRGESTMESLEFFGLIGKFFALCLLNDLPLPHRFHPVLFLDRFGYRYSRNHVKDFNDAMWKVCAYAKHKYEPTGHQVNVNVMPHLQDYLSHYDIPVSVSLNGFFPVF